jgi:uncharacterized protein (TIGR02145 family)
LAAQDGNGVKVSGLVVSVGSPTTVTFNVSWDKNDPDMPTLWVDSAWVFVDYNKNGVMERLQLSAGATLTATSAEGVGKVIPVDGNTQGVWVVGNAKTASSGSFSAKVELLTATTGVAGACAYASNYPPVGEYSSASEISFIGTPEYKVVLERSDKSTYTATVGKDESLSIPNGEAVLSFTDKTGAPGKLGCIPPTAYDLNVSASSFCAGVGVTFTLSGTENGRSYELYRNGAPTGVATLMGDESAAAFSGTFDVAGVYTAASVADEVYCALSMTGAHTIAAYPAFTAGEITSAATTTKAGTNPNVTIANATPASGGDGSITYQWRRTGTSSATLTGSNATYTFSSDAAGNYGMVGTYSFNRYAKDSACSTTWVAAFGAYTLTVEAGGNSQPQGSCTYTTPAVVGTFAAFPNNYSGGTYVSLTDERDNKNYPVVKIGGRWIMARNLNYQTGLTWQANSNSPSTVSGSNTALIGSFWCPGGYSSPATTSTRASCDVWGALYSWETAMSFNGLGAWTEAPSSYNTGAANTANAKANHGRTASGSGRGGRGICPPNWHVPTDNEWGILLDGMESAGGTAHQNASGTGTYGKDAGSRAKSKCTVADKSTTGSTYVNDTQANWYYYSSTLGTDALRFRALPSGNRTNTGSSFYHRGLDLSLWSSSLASTANALYREFSYDLSNTLRKNAPRSHGAPTRCMRDL